MQSPRVGIVYVLLRERRHPRDRYRLGRWAREGKIKGTPRTCRVRLWNGLEHPPHT